MHEIVSAAEAGEQGGIDLENGDPGHCAAAGMGCLLCESAEDPDVFLRVSRRRFCLDDGDADSLFCGGHVVYLFLRNVRYFYDNIIRIEKSLQKSTCLPLTKRMQLSYNSKVASATLFRSSSMVEQPAVNR